MDKELLAKLIGYVENASPAVWEMAMRQVEVQIWRYQFGMWSLFILAAVILVVGSYFVFLGDEEPFGLIISITLSTLFVGVGLYIFVDLTSIKMNPEFYAIKILIETIK